MKTFLTISFALFFALCATANQENPTTNTIPVIDRLASIAWKQNLGGDDLSFVTNSLFSESDLVSQEALTALVAAAPMECLDLYAAAEKSRRPRRTTCIRVANILLEGGRKGERLLSTLRSSFIRENLPKQVGYISGPYAGRFSPSQERHATAMASRIAAIVIAKDLRAGKRVVFNSEDYAFSRFDELLLEYSRLDRWTAITTIQEKLADETTPDIDKWELRRVLKTYHPDERNHDQPTVGMERKPDR